MTKTETMRLLNKWQAHHAALETLMDGVQRSIGLDPDAPFFDTIWKLFDAYTRTLAAQVGDEGEWMAWYQNENEMGAKKMNAGYDGKTKPIKTIAQLSELIAESHRRIA